MTLKTPILLASVLGALALATSSDARACGYFDYRQIRPVVHVPKPAPIAANVRIANAEQRLDEEHLTAAGAEVVLAFPSIRHVAVGASPLETRALHILSLAVVRGEGSLRGVAGFAGTGATERAANLEWAASTLRALDVARPNDPVTQADLAEALAARPQHEDESLAILADLAGRDLVGSAHAYAALARLQASRGDMDATRAALARCERMTRSPTVVCRAPDGRLAFGG
ncbi:MAG TPA: hypothetical protein VGL81_12060 [Polyangiaceae bacterium]|jgi:hypothetical protein